MPPTEQNGMQQKSSVETDSEIQNHHRTRTQSLIHG